MAQKALPLATRLGSHITKWVNSSIRKINKSHYQIALQKDFLLQKFLLAFFAYNIRKFRNRVKGSAKRLSAKDNIIQNAFFTQNMSYSHAEISRINKILGLTIILMDAKTMYQTALSKGTKKKKLLTKTTKFIKSLKIQKKWVKNNKRFKQMLSKVTKQPFRNKRLLNINKKIIYTNTKPLEDITTKRLVYKKFIKNFIKKKASIILYKPKLLNFYKKHKIRRFRYRITVIAKIKYTKNKRIRQITTKRIIFPKFQRKMYNFEKQKLSLYIGRTVSKLFKLKGKSKYIMQKKLQQSNQPSKMIKKPQYIKLHNNSDIKNSLNTNPIVILNHYPKINVINIPAFSFNNPYNINTIILVKKHLNMIPLVNNFLLYIYISRWSYRFKNLSNAFVLMTQKKSMTFLKKLKVKYRIRWHLKNIKNKFKSYFTRNRRLFFPKMHKFPLSIFNSFLRQRPLIVAPLNLTITKSLLKIFSLSKYFNSKKQLIYLPLLISGLFGVITRPFFVPKMSLLKIINGLVLRQYAIQSLETYSLKNLYHRLIFFASMAKSLSFSIQSFIQGTFKITFQGMHNRNVNASFLSRFIEMKLGQYFTIQEIFRIALKEIKKSSAIQGYKIMVAGRLTRTERAAFHLKKQGNLPVGTFSKYIEYSEGKKIMKFGLTGLKIFLNIKVSKLLPNHYIMNYYLIGENWEALRKVAKKTSKA